jgi:hypothetical protein
MAYALQVPYAQIRGVVPIYDELVGGAAAPLRVSLACGIAVPRPFDDVQSAGARRPGARRRSVMPSFSSTRRDARLSGSTCAIARGRARVANACSTSAPPLSGGVSAPPGRARQRAAKLDFGPAADTRVEPVSPITAPIERLTDGHEAVPAPRPAPRRSRAGRGRSPRACGARQGRSA